MYRASGYRLTRGATDPSVAGNREFYVHQKKYAWERLLRKRFHYIQAPHSEYLFLIYVRFNN